MQGAETAACCLQQPRSPQPKFAEGEFGLCGERGCCRQHAAAAFAGSFPAPLLSLSSSLVFLIPTFGITKSVLSRTSSDTREPKASLRGLYQGSRTRAISVPLVSRVQSCDMPGQCPASQPHSPLVLCYIGETRRLRRHNERRV